MPETQEKTAVDKLKAWLAQNREELEEMGVHEVYGEYSGSGDSGQFDGISTYPNGLEGSLPPLRGIDPLVTEGLEDIFDAVTDQVATPGFENNDGGGGTITVDVRNNRIFHTAYYYETVRTDEEAVDL